jgi:hypothetical protein
MSDIVERLNAARGFGDRAGTADGDINVLVRTVPVALLDDAVAEIERLRSIAGKADVGPSFAEITKDLPRRSNEPQDPS